MKYIVGDLLEGEWDCAGHCCNNYKTMGSGVAYFLRKKWPEVYEADLMFDEFDELDADEKIGKFSVATVEPGKTVYNLYAMWGLGNNGSPLGRNCTYDGLYNSLYEACKHACENKPLVETINFGIPYLAGCVRAGGSWVIVEAILKDIESIFPIEFTIYQLPDGDIKADSTIPTHYIK
jgi:O-acetyl-ADP-ribose deacetylase (regulator of RNase III)